ncbi:hypothetical protein L1887_01125 [Cichorium endivia]|nr:hypothetical protein L1887_01125 [Cichorium endivia]
MFARETINNTHPTRPPLNTQSVSHRLLWALCLHFDRFKGVLFKLPKHKNFHDVHFDGLHLDVETPDFERTHRLHAVDNKSPEENQRKNQITSSIWGQFQQGFQRLKVTTSGISLARRKS